MSDFAEIRSEVLRFLYERQALPHQRSAVAAGLRRAGTVADDEAVTAALDYLTSAGLVTRVPGALGGGSNHAAWRITHTGVNAWEEQHG
jgi:hypothetical protein